MSPAAAVAALWAAFLVTHLAMSHPPARAKLVASMGDRAFQGLYSVVALVLFTPMTILWWRHRGEGAPLWNLRGVPGVEHVAELVVLAGFALMAGSFARPAPSAIPAQLMKLKAEVVGMSAVTRHPLFMGMALWAAGHLLVNGTPVDVAFWAGFPVTTVVGGWHQDWRKSTDPAYAAFVGETAFVPFARPDQLAKVGGRAWAFAAVGMVVAVLLRMAHPYFMAR